MQVAGTVQAGAKGRDLSVHHGARRDQVSAGVGVGDGSLRQQRQRGVVVYLAPVQHAAVAVRGVLAQADVGRQNKADAGVADAAQRAWHRPLGIGCSTPNRVLRIGDSEQEHAADTQTCKLGRLGRGQLGAQAGVARQRRDGFAAPAT